MSTRLLLLVPVITAGCTLWEVRTPCDSAPEVSFEQDPLWSTGRTTWQKPAVGDGFVCGFEREDGDIALPAPLDNLRCVGPTAAAVWPPDTTISEATALVSGGGMLCAVEEAFGDPAAGQEVKIMAFDCWGPGADEALDSDDDMATRGLRQVLADPGHDPAVLHSLSPAESYLCAVATLRKGLSGDSPEARERKSVFCRGAGSVVEQAAAVQEYRFDEVQTSATMACGRADVRYRSDGTEGPLNPPEFVCWGDGADSLELRDGDQDFCWSTFDVTDGVLCATGSPPPLDGTADPCPDTPPVKCWGPSDHPIVAGLATADEVLGATATPIRLSLGPDFACAHYETNQQGVDDSVLCWGAPESAAAATPRGGAWQDLAVAPEAGHACALDQSEQDLDEGTTPPPPTGRLTCWGDSQDGALALE